MFDGAAPRQLLEARAITPICHFVLTLRLIPTFPGAHQEQTFLSMASTLPTQDQLGRSAMASTVLIFSIQQFFTVYNNRVVVMGSDATKKMLSKSLFFISVRSNDIFGYFLTNSTMPPELYITHLMHQYEAYIKVVQAIRKNHNLIHLTFLRKDDTEFNSVSLCEVTLYNFGAKKFGIIGVPPIGCYPAQRRYNATRGCQEGLNDFARAFHFALDTLMRKISTELPEMKYSLGNTWKTDLELKNTIWETQNLDVRSSGKIVLPALLQNWMSARAGNLTLERGVL
ncbi:hypothetical protein HYC85_017279 [Camellia sinensis]|uniref:GDSL esterase/lipase n=1 Tax=Camellia sinensis TaxID=4442 RepID=A0A7J7H494_CAMSI|nr:hypothetical protein HYC85_017279 [Camellia sinensis]